MNGQGMDIMAIRVRIEGRVQGVGYRAWAVREATRLGLHGWICNLSDGSVEALIAGPADKVEEMLTLCGRGPDYAEVEDVIVEESEEPVLATGFRLITEAERNASCA